MKILTLTGSEKTVQPLNPANNSRIQGFCVWNLFPTPFLQTIQFHIECRLLNEKNKVYVTIKNHIRSSTILPR